MTSSTTPPAPTSNTLLFSVADPGRDTVTLYRVDQARHATKLQTVSKPDWANVVDAVQQSAGISPLLCVVFSEFNPDSDFKHESWCYPAGSASGYELPLEGRLATAVSADGRTMLAMSDTATRLAS